MNEIFCPRTKVLNEILDKCKNYGDKRDLRYINKDETPSSGETVFVKGKNDTLNQLESPKKTSLYTHYKKTGHSQFRCYTRFLESLKLKWINLWMTLILLKITSWTMWKGIKPIRGLEVNLVPPSHHLGLSKFGWEMIGLNVKLCLMLLKLNLLVSGTFIVVALDTW